MQSITDHLALDHERCDALFARIESALADDNAAQAQTAFAAFHRAMQHHFSMEEAILFPAYEANSDDLSLSHMMRLEHEQMRELIEQMKAALNSGSLQACTGLTAAMSPLMQLHNQKEEELLYPLLDRKLGEKSAELIERIEALPLAGS